MKQKLNNTKVHNVISVSKTIYSQKKPEKSGLLKRFLAWIARGAVESHGIPGLQGT